MNFILIYEILYLINIISKRFTDKKQTIPEKPDPIKSYKYSKNFDANCEEVYFGRYNGDMQTV